MNVKVGGNTTIKAAGLPRLPTRDTPCLPLYRLLYFPSLVALFCPVVSSDQLKRLLSRSIGVLPDKGRILLGMGEIWTKC